MDQSADATIIEPRPTRAKTLGQPLPDAEQKKFKVRTVCPVTIQKEITSFKTCWEWGLHGRAWVLPNTYEGRTLKDRIIADLLALNTEKGQEATEGRGR